MLKTLFSYERMSRLMVSLLLCLGVLWPLMWALEIQNAFLPATLAAAAVILLCTLSGLDRRLRFLIGGAAAAVLLMQLFLPGYGLIGQMVEAVKAFALYLNGFNCAASLYRMPLALTLAVLAAMVSYLFSHKGAGFIPATVLLVLVLFGLWSLGKHNFFWFAAPGLVALLMIISQSSHEKINLFEVLPMGAVVVALAMLLTPGGKTVIEPLHKAAMELKETIADYLFFTDPRNVFTLGTYGYYPMGQNKLGGPAEPSEYPVMMVQTEKKTLMRAVTKDQYTGRNWQDSASGRRLLYVNPGWRSLRMEAFLEDMPDVSVQRASTMLDVKAVNVQMRNKAASTLFAPVFLRDVSPQGSLVPYFNESSELFATRDLEPDDRYSVFAPILEGGDAQLGALVSAAASQTDPYYMGVYARYTQLPSHLEETLFYDTQNIVAGSATPYDKACAIQRHLQRYYRYTLSPEEPPENQDFVTYFLYVGKEGYCTYFASAMTVMCRLAGLPARYVEGFLAEPAADGIAYVTGQNAHAWTEVYFEGFGWVPFDPTPGQMNMDRDPPPQDDPEPTPTPTPTPEPTPSPTPTHDPNSNEPTPSPTPSFEEPTPEPPPLTPPPERPPEQDDPDLSWLWWLLAIAVLAALIVRMILRSPDRVAAKQEAVQDQLFIYGNAVAQVLRMRGHKVQPGETPMLFARRMDRQNAAGVPVTPLWRAMTLSNYSRRTPTQKLTEQAREIFHGVWQPQPFYVKLRFLAEAAFSGRFYHVLETAVEHVEVKPQYALPVSGDGRKAGKRGQNKPAKQKKHSKPEPGRAQQLLKEQEHAEIDRTVQESLNAATEQNAPKQTAPEQNPAKQNAVKQPEGGASAGADQPAAFNARPVGQPLPPAAGQPGARMTAAPPPERPDAQPAAPASAACPGAQAQDAPVRTLSRAEIISAMQRAENANAAAQRGGRPGQPGQPAGPDAPVRRRRRQE